MDKEKNSKFKEKLIKAHKEMSDVIDSYKAFRNWTNSKIYWSKYIFDSIVNFLNINEFKSWLNHGYYEGVIGYM